MNKYIVILTSVTLILTGCSYTPFEIDNKTGNATTTPTATVKPEPTEVPHAFSKSESGFDKEDWVSIESEYEGDTLEDFIRKIEGVWAEEGGFFEFFDGTTITRGEFGSDYLPDAHIAKVTELSENKYEVYIENRGVVDNPEAGYEYHGEDYTVIIDGSWDGFKTVFIVSSGDRSTLFVKMGENFEEADKYYWNGFVDDYRKLNYEIMGVEDFGTLASGLWYTEDYDEYNNWATSYRLDLGRDGIASCFGYRNKDIGTYKITGENTVLITFDHCEIDAPGEGWIPVDGFVYTIEMTIDGDDAAIKIDAPDVITNLTDGVVHRKIKYM